MTRPAASTLCILATTLALAAGAEAAPAPPFKQCPPVGRDAGCGSLIVAGAGGRLEAFNDPRTGPFGDSDDVLIGVQNESSAALESIPINSVEMFSFDGDGVCSGTHVPSPAGCPFGPTGYEGPGVEILRNPPERGSSTIRFAGAGLAPGASTYFSLEGITLEGRSELACGPEAGQEACRTLEPTTLELLLSGGGKTAQRLAVGQGLAATGQVTLAGFGGGPGIGTAGGTVEYEVFSDSLCTHLAADAGTVAVAGGSVPASGGVTLAPGTYYWRATYSGDGQHAGFQTPCGAVLEFVTPECSAAEGSGRQGPPGAAGLAEHNRLSLSGSPSEFVVSEPGLHVHLRSLSSATCTGYREFTGTGLATVNGASGYSIWFAIGVSEAGVMLSVLVEREGSIVLSLSHEKLRRVSSEHFS